MEPTCTPPLLTAMSQHLATRARTGKPDPTLLSFLEVEDHRDLLMPWLDARDFSRLMAANRATRGYAEERLGVGELVRRVREVDVEAGIHVPYLRHLVHPEFALQGGEIRLAVGVYDLCAGGDLRVETKGLRLLGEEEKKDVHPPLLRSEGVVITRAVDCEFALHIFAEGVVIEQVSVRNDTEHNRALFVMEPGSATVTCCDLHGQVGVAGGAKVQLNDSDIQGLRRPQAGIQAMVGSEVVLLGTSIRRCRDGVFVMGQLTLRKGCRITDNMRYGLISWGTGEGPAKVTVEDGAVCEGNNTSSTPNGSDFVTFGDGTFIGVAEDLIGSLDV